MTDLEMRAAYWNPPSLDTRTTLTSCVHQCLLMKVRFEICCVCTCSYYSFSVNCSPPYRRVVLLNLLWLILVWGCFIRRKDSHANWFLATTHPKIAFHPSALSHWIFGSVRSASWRQQKVGFSFFFFFLQSSRQSAYLFWWLQATYIYYWEMLVDYCSVCLLPC